MEPTQKQSKKSSSSNSPKMQISTADAPKASESQDIVMQDQVDVTSLLTTPETKETKEGQNLFTKPFLPSYNEQFQPTELDPITTPVINEEIPSNCAAPIGPFDETIMYTNDLGEF